MRTATAQPARRGRYRGTVQIFLYNWPSYVFGALACLVSLALAVLVPLPSFARLLLVVGAACAAFWLAASVIASYWVYDHSDLCQWDWIRGLFPVPPNRWANIHAGLDETSLKLLSLFPRTGSTILEIYDPEKMTEPSIRRARRLTPAPVPATHAEI